MTQPTQEYIESRLASVEPDVEVLLVEQVSPGKVRLFIDSTDGVDLALCERVTNHLRDLLVDYSLEDSLLSAYKKTPGAAKYARVDMDRASGDFKVFELLIPADLEERLLSEVETEEPTVDPETGEMREPPEPELDPELLAQYSDQNVAREPGYRSKIAVVSHAGGVDPVGACVGPRGSRVRMVVSELRGEKIDIIPFNEEPARFVAKALSPARVREVLVDDDNKQATVVVPDDQLSLAIGKEGQNARLAARLTGWRVDIKSETEFAEVEAELGLQPEEDVTGRCHAILSSGKRCPNAALPGSRYCGLPAHQALAEAEQRGEAPAVVAEEPAEEPAAEEPVAEEPVAEEPVAEELAPEEPAETATETIDEPA